MGKIVPCRVRYSSKLTHNMVRLGMQVVYGRVHRKTAPIFLEQC